tara:strand:+ start:942 stop:1565 length:624 start_codon:yes stop_codon:yes gene_type:complete
MDKSIKKGRKNPDYYENFFDNYLLDIVDIVKPYFHKLGFTPNLITIIGFVFGLFSVYLLYTNHFFLFGFFWIASYFFDCLDGNFARTYNQVTDFGDFLDHTADLIKILLLVYIGLIYKLPIYKKATIFIVCITSLLLITCIYHLGCIEKLKKEKERARSLHFATVLCNDPYKNAHYLPHLGTGTLIFSVTILVMFYPQIDYLLNKLF